jgi:Fe-S cluster biogenesis protein NfuA
MAYNSQEAALVRSDVERVLGRIRRALQADGGDVELVGIEGQNARVILSGPAVEHLSSMMTLKFGIERALREEIKGFGEVIAEPEGGGATPPFDY